MAPPRSRRGSLSRNKDKGKCSSVFSLQLKHGGWLRDGEYLGGSSDYFYNMEIDHWGLIILNDKLKELKYMNIDNVKYFLKTKGGVVELVNEVVAWQTFNELDLLDGVEVWAVNGEWETEIDEQYWLHDSDSDEGLEEFVDSDLESNADLVDDLEYDNNIDSNVEFCGTGEVVEGEQEQVSNLEVELDFSDEDSLRDNSSDDDRFPILPHFKEKTQMKSPKFSVGLSFKSKAQFKQAVKNYGFANGKEIKFVKDDKGRVVGKCKHDTCQWEIRAKKENMGMDWIVSTFNDVHEGCTWTWKNKMANSTVVAQRWKREIQAHDNWKTANFCEKVVNEEKFFINKRQAYRALVKAKASIEAEQHDNFKKLWSYIKEIKKNNPNTTISAKLSDLDDYETGKKRFLRMYICWEASRVGYRFCRPIIGVDGCFLKSKYGGQLLLAVGVDGDDSIFPLAYAIVENETKDSWTWFLERLKRGLSISDDNQHELTFISDKQKGLLPAFDSVFPGARHRFCVRHLHGNMKVAGFTGKALKNALWEAARCTTVSTFKESMKKIKDLDPKAYEWLVSKDPSEWSRAYFTDHPHCDMLVNNVCESFNATIIEARQQPILSCLESVRKILMSRFFERKQQAEKWKGPLCPRILSKIVVNEKSAASFMVTQCGEFKFEIKGAYGQQYEEHCVDLEKHNCSCRSWDLSGIPCRHVICAIWIKHGKGPVYDYVHNSYLVQNYKKAYEGSINPMAGPTEWPIDDREPPLPPLYTARAGRPSKLRKKSGGEQKKVVCKDGKHLNRSLSRIHCSICKKDGHNKRRCPEDPAVKERLSNPKKRVRRKETVQNQNQISQPPTSAPVEHVQPTTIQPDEMDSLLGEMDLEAMVSQLINTVPSQPPTSAPDEPVQTSSQPPTSAPVEPVQTPRQPQKQPNEDNEVPPDCRVS